MRLAKIFLIIHKWRECMVEVCSVIKIFITCLANTKTGVFEILHEFAFHFINDLMPEYVKK